MGVIGKTLRFTFGLALGAGIGAVGAMVAAPQSGKVTKEEIRSRVDGMMQAAKEARTKREHELQAYWEQEINKKSDDKKEKSKEKK